MKSRLIGAVLAVSLCFTAGAVFADKKSQDEGVALFKQHCSVCHPDGSNIINPKKTLQWKDRKANGVKTAKDIMHLMRHPGPGMTSFDEKTISNKDAHEIAEYIMKTFK